MAIFAPSSAVAKDNAEVSRYQLGGGLPELGVRRPWLTLVMNLLIAIAGVAALLAIEVRELPDVDRPIVSVRALMPGASPETMDAEVTRLLEGAVARVSAGWRSPR